MSCDVRDLVDTVLHEGYLLYPYRRSALKNHHRYLFGTLYPEEFCRTHGAGDPSSAQTECIAHGGPTTRVGVQLRFLQFSECDAVVRETQFASFSLAELTASPRRACFEFPPVHAAIAMEARQAEGELWKISLHVRNAAPANGESDGTRSRPRDEALRHALGAAHLVISSEGGTFLSLIDPPETARELVGSCRNVGLWPVLVGQPPRRDTLLAAPIILYDYPELAPESFGDFFDGTEIDELLTLRVLTLTDDEKREMAKAGARARTVLERTEASGLAGLGPLHGRMLRAPSIRPGARVRLHPRRRADIFDIALAGKLAVVDAVERDFEGRTYVAVTVEDDPGHDMGAYGHRFFFWPEEVELL